MLKIIGRSWGSVMSLSLALLFSSAAEAVPLVLSGRLNDPSNTALVAPDLVLGGLTTPGFADDNAVALNVALYQITVTQAGAVSFVSTGFAAGGASPYFTLFGGWGDSASFAASNYDDAFLGDGGDFSLSAVLAAGQYTVAMGDFANMSLAENLGFGSLADGFTGLGDPSQLGDSSYLLTITEGGGGGGGGGTVPEPASAALVLAALMAGMSRRPVRSVVSRSPTPGTAKPPAAMRR